ncbi:IQ and ubiquitin-like domain-containing protein [Lampris incognitus]|uniref:IQ and ubiquitin-like domain-containing protein n=1 Tax=Lampris incognitus TaxID=2546036 RepID=UPI0024B59624|nr:IQ and ubiquitin-like domain-containing protein [Lampris incognitus]
MSEQSQTEGQKQAEDPSGSVKNLEHEPHADGRGPEDPPGGDRSPAADDGAAPPAAVGTGRSETAGVREGGGESPQRNSTATVKVILVPEGNVLTEAFVIGLSIQQLKHHFARELKVPAEVLQIFLDGDMVEDQRSLMELGVQPHGTARLEMSSTEPNTHPLRPLRPPQQYNMPDVITVRVQKDAEAGVFQEVVVEIERPPQQKAFLGGYRHQLTGAEYHHAAVQTATKRRPDRGVVVFSRDTQTVTVKHQAQQCAVSSSTQMTGVGCYVSSTKDKLVAPGNYITADQLHSKRLAAVIQLQSYVRRWRAQQLVEGLRRDRERRLAWLEMEERRRREEKEERFRDQHRRRLNPQSREDFTLIYNTLERWRREETERIDAMLHGAERKAALCLLVEQETQLIATIGRHCIIAQNNNYEKAVRAFLDKCAASKRWHTCDGKIAQMDTQSTIRASELRDLYLNISFSGSTQEERLQLLSHLKNTVKEHDCQLTRDIVELIDREAVLMSRGVKQNNLRGLRKRISTLFLQLIKRPSFNPAVAKLLKVPQISSQLKTNIHYCPSCQCYLQSSDYSLTANAHLLGRCQRCAALENKARQREDFSVYRTILTQLRRDEELLLNEAKITYLLQEKDVQYLVDVVWGAQSALTACRDLHELKLIRWECCSPWSPWNCILVSKEEARAHLTVENLHQAYGPVFIRTVKHKHILAQRYFAQFPTMAEYLNKLESQSGSLSTQLVSKSISSQSST